VGVHALDVYQKQPKRGREKFITSTLLINRTNHFRIELKSKSAMSSSAGSAEEHGDAGMVEEMLANLLKTLDVSGNSRVTHRAFVKVTNCRRMAGGGVPNLRAGVRVV
jgi:hypothetical protein